MPVPPLAQRLRPQSFEDVVGQEHLLNEQGTLARLIKQQRPMSLLFWGPPGTGKTTLAKLYAKAFDAHFVTLSGISSGVAEIRQVVKEAQDLLLLKKYCLVFMDEIHRFNKAQQDSFLPYVEQGTFVLVGATTENPSFCLNNALLSRLQVLPVYSLKIEELEKIYQRCEGRLGTLKISKEAKQRILELANGDGRYLINLIESLPQNIDHELTVEEIGTLLQQRFANYDRHSDGHFQLISALHKSVRGSDPQAALYWLSRMLEGGEDPLYIARRLIRMASEDIGLADPQALSQCLDAYKTYEILGSPEGEIALAQATVYLALSPKSNRLYEAFNNVWKQASESHHLPPPSHIMNAPTKMMRGMGFGEHYIYDPHTPNGFSGQDYFPKGFQRQDYYKPVERGFEREMKKRLEYFDALRKNLNTTY
jgi:putative ATPase